MKKFLIITSVFFGILAIVGYVSNYLYGTGSILPLSCNILQMFFYLLMIID